MDWQDHGLRRAHADGEESDLGAVGVADIAEHRAGEHHDLPDAHCFGRLAQARVEDKVARECDVVDLVAGEVVGDVAGAGVFAEPGVGGGVHGDVGGDDAAAGCVADPQSEGVVLAHDLC